MPGTRTSILSLLLAAPALLIAAPDYLPLQNGNSWLYVPGPIASGVSGIETVGDRTYSVTSLLGREYRLRRAEDNTIYQYHPDTQAEDVFLAFGAEVNQPFATSIDPCVVLGAHCVMAEKVSGPLGDFDNVLHISFAPSCADAGLSDAWFLPYIGMIRYQTESIAGPRTVDLTYSKTGIVEVSTGLLTSKLSLSVPVSTDLRRTPGGGKWRRDSSGPAIRGRPAVRHGAEEREGRGGGACGRPAFFSSRRPAPRW